MGRLIVFAIAALTANAGTVLFSVSFVPGMEGRTVTVSDPSRMFAPGDVKILGPTTDSGPTVFEGNEFFSVDDQILVQLSAEIIGGAPGIVPGLPYVDISFFVIQQPDPCAAVIPHA
jgi:hypothetical protein